MTNDLLTSSNLHLRAVEPDDIDLLLEWENDPSIWKVSNTLIPFSRFEIEEYVLDAKRDIFTARQLRLIIDLVLSKGTLKAIGTIDLFDFDPVNLRAGIGVMIRPEYRGEGYAREALNLMIAYVKEILHLHQLYCNISADNELSVSLFEKTGFVQCGRKKEWLNSGFTWLDEYMYQLIL